MYIPEKINRVINKLEESGYLAFCVGGCVRDALRGAVPHDWDITTSAFPDEVKRVFSDFKVIETGIKHGTVTVHIEHEPIEITTFREDGEYKDRRRPENVSFTRNIENDLRRRDFTINAMAYSESRGLIDLFGGVRDLENKMIRAVGDPEKRFNEDGLRLLRALRFSSVLGFEIEKDTEDAIRRCKDFLSDVSGERIYSEITGMLLGENALSVMLKYADVLAAAVPGIAPAIGFEQKSRYHIYDVWEHTARAVCAAPKDEVLRWALLFHDLGKPDTFSVDSCGGHFYGHAEISAEKARAQLSRMGVSHEKKDRICRLIKYHDSDLLATDRSIKRWLSRLSLDELLMLLQVKTADNSAQSPEYDRAEAIREDEKRVREVAERQPCVRGDSLTISGHDLMALGAEGAQIGKLKSALLEKVIDEECENTKEELIKYAALLLPKL